NSADGPATGKLADHAAARTEQPLSWTERKLVDVTYRQDLRLIRNTDGALREAIVVILLANTRAELPGVIDHFREGVSGGQIETGFRALLEKDLQRMVIGVAVSCGRLPDAAVLRKRPQRLSHSRTTAPESGKAWERLRQSRCYCLRRSDLSAQETAQSQILRVHLVPVGRILSVQAGSFDSHVCRANGHARADLALDRHIPLLGVRPDSPARAQHHSRILPVINCRRSDGRLLKILRKAIVPVESGRDSHISGGKARRCVESVGRESDAGAADVPIENSVPRTHNPVRRKTVCKADARAEIFVIRISQTAPPVELRP